MSSWPDTPNNAATTMSNHCSAVGIGQPANAVTAEQTTVVTEK